jgi:predicted AAA+ superfamily ATPase
MYARIIQPPERASFFLFGPRGVGKSSWVKSHYPQASYIDLLDAEIYTDLMSNPTHLGRYINIPNNVPPHVSNGTQTGKNGAASGRNNQQLAIQVVIIDEVQKIPALLDEVHRQIESKTKNKPENKNKNQNQQLQFVLTGSSARKLKRTGVNLLAGRAFQLALFPLTAAELGNDFSLKTALDVGMLPAIHASESPQKYLKAYVQTYLREEVMQEGLTRNLPAFSRFMEAASFSQGGVLNVSTVAEDCGVPRKTVENYFDLLEDLLLASRITNFTKRAKRKLIGHPKFYYFDVGVFKTLRPQGPLDSPDEANGIALETLVFQEIRALNAYLELNYAIHFWRTESQLEVDFVLYGERGLKAIEIKKSSRLRDEDLNGLKAFLKDYPMAQAFLLYGGARSWTESGIQIMPVTQFFQNSSAFLSDSP